ncbi:glycosyltransferase family 2 protein [uncultured Vibrio sp.]|uniref:glycosyltransferase family 2 protein n=1 Tax=uncultured Vibrio sp. TaxID=114054 RepID=UPI00091BA72D|nr:glycosyltransferase family 2 protein [uncultured Vibrio sp.]OIQ25376.1 MAG: hypothetical protein BM561_06325 [Vibrio sp. MedPE-SWchi]
MQNYKIKLAAIARDEAAYLPEWIFHHLHFGFDEIELYINNTEDNSLALLSSLSDLPVTVTMADELFKSSKGDFQFRAYREIAKKAVGEGFSHVMFLDIDEFWTPSDFSSSIKRALDQLGSPSVLSFNWLLHCDESEFSACYDEKFQVKRSDHIKTIFKLDVKWQSIGAHNIISSEVEYKSADGRVIEFEEDDPHRAIIKPSEDSLPPYFVIHRMFRSELEYISLLGRGRPSSLKIKNNRPGYYHKFGQKSELSIDPFFLQQYQSLYQEFVQKYDLEHQLERAQRFVSERYKHVLSLASKAKGDDVFTFYKVFDAITLEEIISIKNNLEKKILSGKAEEVCRNLFSFELFVRFLKAKIWYKLGKLERSHFHYGQIDKKISSPDALDASLLNKVLSKNALPKTRQANIQKDIAVELTKEEKYDEALSFIDKALDLNPTSQHLKNIRTSTLINMQKSK